MKRTKGNSLALLPLDTAGEWNRPLLENAAAMSEAECVFAASGTVAPLQTEGASTGSPPLEEVLEGFQYIIACEAVRDSENIYDFPAPRGRTAVIVGNEEKGIPRSVLKKADSIVAIPMSGAGMSSVNVAVSAAIALYVLSKDLGRRKRVRGDIEQRNIDVLIHAPADPHELGSLLRSAWAFGWRRVFVSDPHGVWFTEGQKTVLDSRAAARRYKNPLAVLPSDQLDLASYDYTLLCDGQREGTPLSRLRLPECRRLLIVCGLGTDDMGHVEVIRRVFLDHTSTEVQPRFRHSGSVLLSIVSELLRGG